MSELRLLRSYSIFGNLESRVMNYKIVLFFFYKIVKIILVEKIWSRNYETF